VAVEVRPRARRAVVIALWAILAFVVWNAVFDRVIVLSGRRYITAAEHADAEGGVLTIDSWMGPTVTRAFWEATLSAAVVAAIGAVVTLRRK
jgi:hypothetical protein